MEVPAIREIIENGSEMTGNGRILSVQVELNPSFVMGRSTNQ